MGINATAMFVRADPGVVPDRVADAIVTCFDARGVTLIDRRPVEGRPLHGIAVSPDLGGWMLVADTDREPSQELAAGLAERLDATVVISSLYEICDPPEPQRNVVYGDVPLDDDGCPCFYEVAAHRYEHLADPVDAYRFFPEPPFDPAAVVFLTFPAGPESAGRGEQS